MMFGHLGLGWQRLRMILEVEICVVAAPVYLQVCQKVYTCVCTSINEYTYIYAHTCTYVHTEVRTFACMDTYIHICTCTYKIHMKTKSCHSVLVSVYTNNIHTCTYICIRVFRCLYLCIFIGAMPSRPA